MPDDYTLAQIVHSREQEARALAAREHLAASARAARPPRPLRLSRALRQLGTWLLGGSPHAASQHG
jgi:hypothetical protein